MDNSIYEVERDEYAGFLSQIKKDVIRVETEDLDNFRFLKTYSNTNNAHLCTRAVPLETNDEDIEHYYIFNMPCDEDRCPPRPVRKIVLETKEEVQAFFDILSKISKGDEG